jgi:hypothetical protein
MSYSEENITHSHKSPQVKSNTFSKANNENRFRTHKSVIGKDIKIKKIGYTGWDLDKILEGKFSQWWKSHRFLFG